MERTGIRERHIAAPEMATSDMAIEAARCALLQRGSCARADTSFSAGDALACSIDHPFWQNAKTKAPGDST